MPIKQCLPSLKNDKSTYPETVKVTPVSDDSTLEELIKLLRGQDADVVTTFARSNSDLQIQLANTAALADVKRFISADLGSYDSGSPRASELMPLDREKTKVGETLQELCTRSKLTRMSLICGALLRLRTQVGAFAIRCQGAE